MKDKITSTDGCDGNDLGICLVAIKNNSYKGMMKLKKETCEIVV